MPLTIQAALSGLWQQRMTSTKMIRVFLVTKMKLFTGYKTKTEGSLCLHGFVLSHFSFFVCCTLTKKYFIMVRVSLTKISNERNK